MELAFIISMNTTTFIPRVLQFFKDSRPKSLKIIDFVAYGIIIGHHSPFSVILALKSHIIHQYSPVTLILMIKSRKQI